MSLGRRIVEFLTPRSAEEDRQLKIEAMAAREVRKAAEKALEDTAGRLKIDLCEMETEEESIFSGFGSVISEVSSAMDRSKTS